MLWDSNVAHIDGAELWSVDKALKTQCQLCFTSLANSCSPTHPRGVWTESSLPVGTRIMSLSHSAILSPMTILFATQLGRVMLSQLPIRRLIIHGLERVLSSSPRHSDPLAKNVLVLEWTDGAVTNDPAFPEGVFSLSSEACLVMALWSIRGGWDAPALWNHYVQSLPTAHGLPVFTSQDSWTVLKPLHLEEPVRCQHHQLTSLWDRLHHVFRSHCSFMQSTTAWQDFSWACAMVRSRCFSYAVPAERLEVELTRVYGRLPSNVQMGKSVGVGSALFPLLDLLNHSPAAKMRWETSDTHVHFVTGQVHPAHTEVFNNYGPKGNEELLLSYGFCLNQAFDEDYVRMSFTAGHETPPFVFYLGYSTDSLRPMIDAMEGILAEHEYAHGLLTKFQALTKVHELLCCRVKDLSKACLPDGRQKPEWMKYVEILIRTQRAILQVHLESLQFEWDAAARTNWTHLLKYRPASNYFVREVAVNQDCTFQWAPPALCPGGVVWTGRNLARHETLFDVEIIDLQSLFSCREDAIQSLARISECDCLDEPVAWTVAWLLVKGVRTNCDFRPLDCDSSFISDEEESTMKEDYESLVHGGVLPRARVTWDHYRRVYDWIQLWFALDPTDDDATPDLESMQVYPAAIYGII